MLKLLRTGVLLLAMLLGAISFTVAQTDDDSGDAPQQTGENCENGWCWGSEPEKAKEKNALYNDALKMKNFAEAAEHLEWLLTNTPNLNRAIYINGIRIYQQLMTETKNPAEKIKYEDIILKLHDDRIKYFGGEADVLARKGAYAYTFINKRENPDVKSLYHLYQRIFDLNKEKTSRSNITLLMVTAMNMRVAGMNAEIKYNNLLKAKKPDAEKEAAAFKESADYTDYAGFTEDWILELYDAVSEALDANIEASKKNPEEEKQWVDTKDKIDGLLPKVVNVDCNFVREKIAPKMEANPADIKLAKRALKYILTAKCLDDPMFLVATRNIFSAEPTGSLASIISGRFMANEEYDSAMVWKRKAIDLYNEEPDKQADLYMDLARIYTRRSNYPEARRHALKSVEADQGKGADAYTLIGDLYMNSGDMCSNNDPVKARACYMAAYDMYAKAGNSEKRARAEAQFPSMEDIFGRNYQLGASLEVGCWIGGSTTIRRRPAQ